MIFLMMTSPRRVYSDRFPVLSLSLSLFLSFSLFLSLSFSLSLSRSRSRSRSISQREREIRGERPHRKHEDSEFAGRGLDLPQLLKDMSLLGWVGGNSVRREGQMERERERGRGREIIYYL